VFPAGCPDVSPSAAAPDRTPHKVSQGSLLSSIAVLGDLARRPPKYDTSAVPASYAESTEKPTEFQLEMRTPRALYLDGGLAQTAFNATYWNHEASEHNHVVQMRMRKLREVAAGSTEGGEQRCSSRWLRAHFASRYPELDTKKAAQRVLLPHLWPALTVTSLPDDIVHFREDRIPTVREVARLQTFPDWFEFKGVRTTGFERRRAGIYVPQYTQVANAVPPRLAHAVAARVKSFLSRIAEDRTCSWEGGAGLDALYDIGVNPPSSTARGALDELNAAFIGTPPPTRRRSSAKAKVEDGQSATLAK